MQTAYTAKAKKAIDIATRISKSLHHSYIGTEHILLGLLKEGNRCGKPGTCRQWCRV